MHKTLDPEWVELMAEARKMGLSPEEIRKFLNRKHLGGSITEITASPLN
nr:anti-repressor SinI family protein [Salimicrobium flavidum]